MNWLQQCVVVIPCLNEEAAISEVVRETIKVLPRTVVVDDGSCDDTANNAKAAGAEAISHGRILGKGAALQTGWNYAKEQGASWVLTMDGDGQHSPGDIQHLLAAAEDGGADLVIGNRMADTRSMPWIRKVVNTWMSKRLSKAAGVSLPDSQCGFRLIRMDALSKLPLETTHFEIESEVLWSFIAKGFSVKFVPIQTIYKEERSKIHPIRDTCRWFRWWRRARKSNRLRKKS
jgi:glycosyltransferase involved in cell wall biosynthesis